VPSALWVERLADFFAILCKRHLLILALLLSDVIVGGLGCGLEQLLGRPQDTVWLGDGAS
jgi:hypothetical protein